MAGIYQGTLGLIGNTPLLEAVNIEKNTVFTHAYCSSWNILIRQEA